MKVEGSNITINDSVYNKMNIIPKGNCGKNKLDLSQCILANCTLNQNGSVTSNISNAYYCSIDASYLKDYILANKGNSITFSLDKAIANKRASILIIGTRTGGGTTQEQNGADNATFVTMQIASDWETITTFAIRFNRSTEVFTDTTTVFNDFMLELNATATTYEPYKNVTGNNSVVVQNKNLAYVELEGKFRNYLNGVITTQNLYNGYIARVKPNTTYIGSYDSSESERIGISNLCYFDKNMNYISGIQYSASQGDIFTTPNNCAFVTVAVIKTQTKFQIEEGSTATPFIPHTEQIATLNLGNIQLNINDSFINESDTWKILRSDGTKETITDTTLINDLNGLQDMLSYNGVTNIIVTSEDTNVQMEVEVTYTSESDMCEKLLFIFNKMKDKLYHIIRSL